MSSGSGVRMAYAERTKTSVEATQAEIKALVKRKGATSFGTVEDQDRAILGFEMRDRRIRFYLPLPHDLSEQATKSRWRGLLLAIKAKLESVENGIETFDEAFLAHVVLPDGSTFANYADRALKAVEQGRPMPPLLEGPK